MKAAYLQFEPRFGEVSSNLRAMQDLAANQAGEADLLVLPELASTGYLFQSRDEVFDLAEAFPGGPTADCFTQMAFDLNAVIVGGFAERSGDQVYNSCALVRPDGSSHIYRKAHLFLDEKDWFVPGDSPFEPVPAAGTLIGMMICFDWYYPEVARLLALRGATIICHPSNLVLPHCPEAMKVRCLENRLFAITANRTGRDERGDRSLSFIGMSQVVDPGGQILVSAPPDGDHVGLVEIDPRLAEDKDVTGRNNWTRDRRIDLFGDLV